MKVVCRLTGLCTLNTETFLAALYTPVVSENSVTSASGDAVQRVTDLNEYPYPGNSSSAGDYPAVRVPANCA
jgi:hypothetical protein